MSAYKVYVACALLRAPSEFITAVNGLKSALRQRGFEVLDFLGTSVGTAQEVYHHDIVECVGKADLVVAICDHPSTGLGYEIAAALLKYHIPVLAVAHKNAVVTRLVLGIPRDTLPFRFHPCQMSVLEALDMLPAFIKELLPAPVR